MQGWLQCLLHLIVTDQATSTSRDYAEQQGRIIGHNASKENADLQPDGTKRSRDMV